MSLLKPLSLENASGVLSWVQTTKGRLRRSHLMDPRSAGSSLLARHVRTSRTSSMIRSRSWVRAKNDGAVLARKRTRLTSDTLIQNCMACVVHHAEQGKARDTSRYTLWFTLELVAMDLNATTIDIFCDFRRYVSYERCCTLGWRQRWRLRLRRRGPKTQTRNYYPLYKFEPTQ